MGFIINKKGKAERVKLPEHIPAHIVRKVDNNPEAKAKMAKLKEAYVKASKNVTLNYASNLKIS